MILHASFEVAEIFCQKCYRSLLELYNVQKLSITSVGEETTCEDPISCDVCNSEINEGSSYYLVYESNLIQVADIISKDIEGCEHCEGNERYGMVAAFNNDPFDPTSRMESPSGIRAYEFLYDQGVPEELISRFIPLIRCSCGYGGESMDPKNNPEGGLFDEDTEVYTRQDINDFWGIDVENFLEFAQQYGIDLTFDDFTSFRQHLIVYPLLAFQHPAGQKIFETIKMHYDKSDFVQLHIKTMLYRGRTRKKDSGKPYVDKEMWSPPEGLPQHGRFNTVGVSVLYVTDRLDGLPFEIHPSPDEYLDVAVFELQRELHLFDIGLFDNEFQGFFNEINEESKPLKKAYLIPNFIGTCCSYIGFDGVRYKGVHQTAGTDYTNFALFKVKPEDMPVANSIATYNPGITYAMSPV